MARPEAFGLARALVLLLLARPALALPPAEIAVSARGECPAAERVQRQLTPLLVETRVHAGPEGSAEQVWVADEGGGFRVKVRDVERSIDNPARDCEERARIAAVLVALVVDPPLPAGESAAAEPAASPRRAEAPAPHPAPPPTAELRWASMVGATAALAPATDGPRTWGAGPVLRALVGQAVWDVSLSAAVISPVTLDLESGGVRLTRFPLDLSASWIFPVAGARGVIGAGVAGDLLHLTGTGVSRAQSSLRFDVGLRSHAGFRFRFGAEVWGVGEVSGTFFPRPYEFEVPPNGVVGHTPPIWLAATLGVLFEIR